MRKKRIFGLGVGLGFWRLLEVFGVRLAVGLSRSMVVETRF